MPLLFAKTNKAALGFFPSTAIGAGSSCGALRAFGPGAARTFALILGLAGVVAAGGEAHALPDTQAEIQAAIDAKARAGGGRVVVAPGIIDVVELRVKSKVILVGSGTLGAPKTRLRLKAKTNLGAVIVGGGNVGDSTGNGIENFIIDGNRINQSPLTYRTVGGRQVPDPRPAVLTLLCSSCSARYVRVVNAMYDGFQVSAARDALIINSSASVVGRYGFFTTDSVDRVRIHKSSAEKTGTAWKYQGGGAGFGAGGKNVEIRYATTRSTNGDGVAAYGSNNVNIKVLDSTFYAPKSHCAHLGGDGPVIARNKCYDPALVGFYIASDWRAGKEAERNSVGGRIFNNYVEDSGSDGIKVQWYIADTLVDGNTVNRSRYNNYGIFDSRGVKVTNNVGRWPSYERPGATDCHLRISNSQVVHSSNNFKYAGRVKPLTC